MIVVCGLGILTAGCGGGDASNVQAGAIPTVGTDAPQEVSLLGTWTGDRERIMADEYHQGSATLTVTEQNGLTFSGTVSWTTPTGEDNETLIGAFTPGAALMSGADDEGTYTFRLIDSTTLDYCYVQFGDGVRVACGRLEKQD